MTTSFCVRVQSSGEDDLEFHVPHGSKGSHLLSRVGRYLDIQELCYFGLSYTNTKDEIDFLKPNKLIQLSKLKHEYPLQFTFRPMYYPEKIEELVKTSTVREFYLYTREQIETNRLECPNKNTRERLNEITTRPEELQMMREYLTIASNQLPSFGVEYFQIIKSNTSTADRPKWLAIHAKGIDLCHQKNTKTPINSLLWKDFEDLSVKGKTLIIHIIGQPNIQVTAPSARIARLIKRLCIGNHRLRDHRCKGENLITVQLKTHQERQQKQIDLYRSRIEELEGEITILRGNMMP